MRALLAAAHFALGAFTGPGDSPSVYSGRENQLAVRIPRLEEKIKIDGVLDEPAWGHAAVLTGFSQFGPSDGVPAPDSTQVLVWYSASAIHFGIRASAPPGSVHATLTDRDKIFNDDYVGILLSTFNDGRSAVVFAVNPFGVQGDGVMVETGQRNPGDGREHADISPDFLYESKGRLTDYGYEVEIRIPFKSIRYQSADPQNWGLSITRLVQSAGREDSWTPAKRAAASYLAQSGTLEGLTGISRGLVLDVNPVLTAKRIGALTDAGYRYDDGKPEVGGNVRWGLTNNLTLNGTYNPDFAEVESDAGQLVFDPRQALFFAEKRPFFFDGSEQFATPQPNTLIYTRRILAPVAATKLTGTVGGTAVGFLSALDARGVSRTGDDNPLFNAVRVQRNLGAQSKLGAVITDKEDGRLHNRVAGVDAHVIFKRLYTLDAQLAGSQTGIRDSGDQNAPMWRLAFDRKGKHFGMHYGINANDERFRTSVGFIPEPGVAHASFSHSLTLYGNDKGLFRTYTGSILIDDTWRYQQFVYGGAARDRKLHLDNYFNLRGGWNGGAGVYFETFGYDSTLFQGVQVQRPLPGNTFDTVAFTGGGTRLPNVDYTISLNSPQLKHGAMYLFAVWGRDENFDEWSSSNIAIAQGELDYNPTERLRLSATYNIQQYRRRSDKSVVREHHIPRLKMEYQVARPVFVRLVGQWDAQFVDALRDDSRTGGPLLFFDPVSQTYVRSAAQRFNDFHVESLFSYQPSPGTVFFAGYGSDALGENRYDFRALKRQADQFFVKASYLFRL